MHTTPESPLWDVLGGGGVWVYLHYCHQQYKLFGRSKFLCRIWQKPTMINHAVHSCTTLSVDSVLGILKPYLSISDSQPADHFHTSLQVVFCSSNSAQKSDPKTQRATEMGIFSLKFTSPVHQFHQYCWPLYKS